MNTTELIQELLDRLPGDHFLVEVANGEGAAQTSNPVDVRAIAQEHKLPLLESPRFVAASQYDIVADKTTYRVQRK